MAAITFTAAQLTTMRRWLGDQCLTGAVTVDFSKPMVNAAFQAIEDLIESPATQTAVSNAINTATAPTVLTGTQKRLIVRAYFFLKYGLS